MSRPPASDTSVSPGVPRGPIALAALVIVAAVLAVYANTLRAPFVFDDRPAIVENPTIRDLGNLGAVLSPPAEVGSSANSRPLVNLSLALNYAAGGLDPTGYHAVNLGLHALAALTLFGLVRRLCLRPALAGRFGPVAWPFALAAALVWAVHPLQTETVTCVIQRTEGMVGLLYLLAAYALVRSADTGANPGARRAWSVALVAACLLGVFTKELIATAPVVLLLLDRTFLAGSFGAAWRQRRGLYLTLAATWLPLAGVVLAGGRRGGTVGFGLGVSSWDYLLTQARALVLYLRLTVWPHPLVLDYGTDVVKGLGEVWPQALLVLALLAVTAVALVRRPVAGFLGAWCFLILAPSSSVVPLTSQTIAEHRMYLPLAALATAAVAGLWARLGRRAWLVATALVLGLGAATVRRNLDYRTALGIWEDTAAKAPDNPRALNNLVSELLPAGRVDEALVHGQRAVELAPADASIHVNLGTALQLAGRTSEALPQYEEGLRLDPASVDGRFNHGIILAGLGRLPEARGRFESVLRDRPGHVGARVNLGNVLAGLGLRSEAIAQYRQALALDAANPEAHYNLGNALLTSGRLGEAAAEYEAALRLKPDYAKAQTNLEQVRRLQASRP
jgi:tetratricopeptide (TPR) repeat protein